MIDPFWGGFILGIVGTAEFFLIGAVIYNYHKTRKERKK